MYVPPSVSSTASISNETARQTSKKRRKKFEIPSCRISMSQIVCVYVCDAGIVYASHPSSFSRRDLLFCPQSSCNGFVSGLTGDAALSSDNISPFTLVVPIYQHPALAHEVSTHNG